MYILVGLFLPTNFERWLLTKKACSSLVSGISQIWQHASSVFYGRGRFVAARNTAMHVRTIRRPSGVRVHLNLHMSPRKSRFTGEAGLTQELSYAFTSEVRRICVETFVESDAVLGARKRPKP